MAARAADGVTVKTILNLTDEYELPDHLDDLDIMEVIEPDNPLDLYHAQQPAFAAALAELVADIPNAANLVVLLPGGAGADAEEAIRRILPAAEIVFA